MTDQDGLPPLRPHTVTTAVDRLLKALCHDHLTALRATHYDDLIDFHFSLGNRIRNQLGLHDIPRLVSARGTANADDASLRILQALWQRLRR